MGIVQGIPLKKDSLPYHTIPIGSSYHLNRILIIYRQCKPWENYLVPKRFTYIYKSDFLPSLWLK